jgi:hypothetical protein
MTAGRNARAAFEAHFTMMHGIRKWLGILPSGTCWTENEASITPELRASTAITSVKSI